MLIKNIFSKNSAWVLGFAVAAIFATTFVSCGGDGDTKYNDVTSSKVPANLADAALLTSLFAAGNDTIVISNPVAVGGVMGEDMVDLGSEHLIIPPGKTLNLAEHPMTITTLFNLVVAGELIGLTEDGEQITNGGTIVVKSAADKTKVDKASSAASVVGGSNGTAGTGDGAAYYFGSIDDDGTLMKAGTGALKDVTTVFGNVTLTKAGAAPDAPNSLTTVYGNVTISSGGDAGNGDIATVTGDFSVISTKDEGIALTVATLNVGGKVSVTGKAALSATNLEVGKNLELGPDVTLAAVSVRVHGNATIAAGKLTVTSLTVGGTYTIDTGVSITNGAITSTAGGAVPAVASDKFLIGGLKLAGAIITGIVIADAATTPKYSLNVTTTGGTLDGITASTLKVTGTVEVDGADNAVGASGIVAVGANSSITVNVGGKLDLNASGSAVTLAGATSTVVLKGASSNSAVLDFTTANAAKADIAPGTTDDTEINATGEAAFKLSAADAATDTDLASVTTIKSFTAAAAAKDTTIKGYTSGTATISASATFVKYS